MDAKQFIEKIAPIAIEDWKERKLVLPSITIAQCMKESGNGSSDLATKANALCGVKAGSDWTGHTYIKESKEWEDGVYVDKQSTFRAYSSWEESILDHNTFIGTRKIGKQTEPNFKEVIGETNVKKAIAGLIGDGVRVDNLSNCIDAELAEFVKNGHTTYTYATSPTYAQSLLSDYIEKYDLTQYDVVDDSQMVDETEQKKEEKNPQKIKAFNIHAGHNPSGMTACGSVGYLNESDENRNVCNALIEKIKDAGHVAYNCTCDNGTSQKDVLQKIVEKCNQHTVGLDISIHFNALSKEYISDGKTKGVEVWIHPNSKGTEVEETAKKICESVSGLGFTNRGVKFSDGLYVLKNTKAPAMLIECCFVDDVDDFQLYNCEKMVQAIYDGLSIEKVEESEEKKLYYVIAGVYSSEENAKSFADSLANKGYLMNVDGNLIKGIATQIKQM